VGEPDPDLVHAMPVRDDRRVGRVGRFDDGGHLLGGELILIDELDDVDVRVEEPLRLGARVGRPVYTPAIIGLPQLVRGALQERARDEEPRPGDGARGDATPGGHERVEWSAEVPRARHARLQELAGGDGHDLFVAIAVELVPTLVVAVPEQLQVHVHVAQTRHDRHPVGVDDVHPLR